MSLALPRLDGTVSVGFDLDLTLVDTRRGTASAIEVVNETLGTSIDVDEFVRTIGGPLRAELQRWVPSDMLHAVIAQFRASFIETGLQYVVAMPGAHEAVALLADRGAKSVVITSRLPHIAEAILAACGLVADKTVGGLTGVEKSPAMREAELVCYVGDHPLDMQGAVAAGVAGIGVKTGSHDERELLAAGASDVVDDLREFSALLKLSH